MTKMLSDGRVQHDAVVGRCPKDECAGDLVAVTGWGAWTDERCVKCNCTWCYQVPRPISDIAGAEAAEKKRRAAAPDLAGQIVSLKDHLRLADARLDAADGLLRRIVEQWDENEVGMLDGEVIEEARAHLDGAAIKSPITDAAIDAAVAGAGEMLNREETEKRLRAFDPPFPEDMIAEILSAPREVLVEASADKDIPPQCREQAHAVIAIVAAHVRWLDKQVAQ